MSGDRRREGRRGEGWTGRQQEEHSMASLCMIKIVGTVRHCEAL